MNSDGEVSKSLRSEPVAPATDRPYNSMFATRFRGVSNGVHAGRLRQGRICDFVARSASASNSLGRS